MSALPDPAQPGEGVLFPTIKSGALSMDVKLDDGRIISYGVQFGHGTEITVMYQPVYKTDGGLLARPEPTGRHNFTVEVLQAVHFHGLVRHESDLLPPKDEA